MSATFNYLFVAKFLADFEKKPVSSIMQTSQIRTRGPHFLPLLLHLRFYRSNESHTAAMELVQPCKLVLAKRSTLKQSSTLIALSMLASIAFRQNGFTVKLSDITLVLRSYIHCKLGAILGGVIVKGYYFLLYLPVKKSKMWRHMNLEVGC